MDYGPIKALQITEKMKAVHVLGDLALGFFLITEIYIDPNQWQKTVRIDKKAYNLNINVTGNINTFVMLVSSHFDEG